MILEGKVALYKEGYHVLLRRLKRVVSERKKLKKEVQRLENVLRMHEDLVYSYFS
jgi:hypothetical protein